MGWIFPPQQIINFHDPYDDRYYYLDGGIVEDELDYATWFQKKWWGHSIWRWVYKNDSSMSLKLNSITFVACSGHSDGQAYCGSAATSGHPDLYADGIGCTFACDVYAIDANQVPIGRCVNFGTGKVATISSRNCAADGVAGIVSKYYKHTSFGDPAFYSGDLALHDVTISYSNPDGIQCPEIPPGGWLMANIRPIYWGDSNTSYTGSNALLVIKGTSAYFSSELIPVDKDYIYVCKQKDGDSSPRWYKEKKAFKRTDAGWEKMKGKA